MLFADWIFALAGHSEQVRAEEVTYFRILCLAHAFMLVSQALFVLLQRPGEDLGGHARRHGFGAAEHRA